MKEGIVSGEPPADLLEGYVVKWSDGSQSQMTDEEAREACDMGRWIQARDAFTTMKEKTRVRHAIWAKTYRENERAEKCCRAVTAATPFVLK